MSEAAHAKFAPSAASRWLHCNASVNYADDSAPGDAAQWGTDVHAILSQGLIIPSHWTSEQKQDCQLCIDTWNDHVPNDHLSELRLASKTWPDLLFGTIDALWLGENNDLNIADLKTGLRGVNAADNAQLMVYAFLASEHYPAAKVFHCKIVQPRRQYVASQTYSCAELETFSERIRHSIESQQLYSTGPHCEFCPGRTECPALRNQLFALLDEAKCLNLWTKNAS